MMQLKSALATRFLPNGRLRNQLKFSKKILEAYPNSTTAQKVYADLKKKFWSANNRLSYFQLTEELWDVLISNSKEEQVCIDGIYFKNEQGYEHALTCEYSEIFLGDPYFIFHSDTLEKEIASKLLPIFFKDGPYQYKNVKLDDGDIVIDAGANMGVFSLFAASSKKVRVYAFEPQVVAKQLLEENVKLNKAENSITVVPLGLSDKNETLELIYNDNLGHIAASILGEKSDVTTVEEIDCVRLDDWVKDNGITKVDFIKVDIEGAERKMLRGAVEIMKKFAPKLSICTYHLPDDPKVLHDIVMMANPNYIIKHSQNKLFAYVPQ